MTEKGVGTAILGLGALGGATGALTGAGAGALAAGPGHRKEGAKTGAKVGALTGIPLGLAAPIVPPIAGGIVAYQNRKAKESKSSAPEDKGLDAKIEEKGILSTARSLVPRAVGAVKTGVSKVKETGAKIGAEHKRRMGEARAAMGEFNAIRRDPANIAEGKRNRRELVNEAGAGIKRALTTPGSKTRLALGSGAVGFGTGAAVTRFDNKKRTGSAYPGENPYDKKGFDTEEEET